MSKVVYEGWLVRYGRRKIGRSFIHMRYFVLETRLLAYYKRKPKDNVVPIKTLLIDGNCRVEDRGLKTHRGHAGKKPVGIFSEVANHEDFDLAPLALEAKSYLVSQSWCLWSCLKQTKQRYVPQS
ncbi:Protein ENHANCED DISEASE RESISTANCE 2-like [Camellia lanceoleosa]|uniref:Protein ENHANCED DISEASE RESISTANCE 2-like n=1 Tax=Camellia lanceoleosa TaxID=1840588 RepID=A0ACC0FNC5_9ERIC|nr:Protein ENHANCED DISEASE RESISTANCE 2-like [Camellia lanceoleosa]